MSNQTVTGDEVSNADRARMRYFAPDGSRLTAIHTMRNEDVAARFPGAVAKRADSFSRWVGRDETGAIKPAVRIIDYKVGGSKHECNVKCMGGSARGVCECRCGGKNHGISSFACMPVAP